MGQEYSTGLCALRASSAFAILAAIMRRQISVFYSAVCLFAVSLPALSQSFRPRAFQFNGDPLYSHQEYMDAAGLKPGTTLTIDQMKGYFQKLLDTGVFESVLYYFDGVNLIFKVTPSQYMYPMRFENLPLAQDNQLDVRLHERFPFYHGKVPNEGGLLDGVRGALEEMLAAEGVNVKVVAAPYTDPALHEVTAIGFSIKTPTILVGEIQLNGTPAEQTPKVMELLSGLSGAPYDTAGIPGQITTNLGNYYHDLGYLEADIHIAQLAPVIAPDVIRIPITVSVSPGIVYKLAGVQLAPGLAVTQADFDKQSDFHPGVVADAVHVRENWEFIERQYHNLGHLKAAVHPTPSFDRANGTVVYTVTVDPGPVYTMGSLILANTADDLRAAMQAAWKIPRGAVLNEGAIRAYFATHGVDPDLERLFATVNCKYSLQLDDDAHTADVTLRLEKRP
jgi:outer membrane protein assembly factor BamA